MSDLRYRAGVLPSDLEPGECCVRSGGEFGNPKRWWRLVICFVRKDNGEQELGGVAVNPRGPAHENGPRTWGLTEVGGGVWQVSPSINYGNDVYHETPRILGVPADEPWVLGHAP